MDLIITFLCSTVRTGMTLLYGSTGEIITEKSGHLNLGIPGIMCVGAASGCFAEAMYIKSLNSISELNGLVAILLGIFAAAFGSALMGVIYSFFTDTLRVNQNVTGLILTTFGVGMTKFIVGSIDQQIFMQISQASKFFTGKLPFVDPLNEYLRTLSFGEPITWIVDVLFSYGVMIYLAIAIAIIASVILKRTRVGLHLRAVGENPGAADAVGINVTAYRYISTIIGSAIAGLGGFCFIIDNLNGMWEYAIEDIGWLAIALVIFSIWRPNLAIFGSILFGGLYIAAEYINLGIVVKPLFKMLPYVVTIIVLIITSIKDKKENQPPAALGLSYFREDR